MSRIRFASSNPIKLEEARSVFPLLEGIGLDVPEIQAIDPETVVRHKLQGMEALGLGGTVLVEDTALHLPSWGGLPGALVKWFVESLGAEGFARLLRAEGQRPEAAAVSAVGVLADGESRVWTGRTLGAIVAPRGELGGWTSTFEVKGTGLTLAEMTFAERMAVTMRREPLERARDWLAARDRLPSGVSGP